MRVAPFLFLFLQRTHTRAVAGCHDGISLLVKPTVYIAKSFKMNVFEGELDI